MSRLYHFQFEGIEKKITIQADSSKRAREVLTERLAALSEYDGKRLIEETTESLVTAVSTRMIDGTKHVWAGSVWKPL